MNIYILSAIVIGGCLIVSALIALLFKPSKNDADTESFSAYVISGLAKTPYLLWFPIKTVIDLIYGVMYRVYSYVSNLLEPSKCKASREQKLIRYAVQTVLHGQSNLLTAYSNRRVARIMTFLLQLISLITTYAGFAFFLGTVNATAPLFMAIVVQGTCYYLLNYSSNRKRTGGWKRIILLVLLISISSVTSYIGIFQGVVRPIDRIEDEYKSYANEVNALIGNRAEQVDASFVDFEDIDECISIIEDVYTEAVILTQVKENLANSIVTEKTVEHKGVRNDGFPYSYTEKVVDAEAKNQVLQLEAEVNELVPYCNELANYFSQRPSNDEILHACRQLIDIPSKRINESDVHYKIVKSLKDALEECRKLYTIMHPNEKKIVDIHLEKLDFTEDYADYNRVASLEEFKMVEFDDLILSKDTQGYTGENNETLDDDSIVGVVVAWLYETVDSINEVVVPKNTTKAQDMRRAVKDAIDDNYIGLSPLLDNLTDKSKLQKAYDKVYIEDPQIMPFTLPFKERGTRGQAVFSLAVALSVDLLSVLIAFALVNRRKSILYVGKIADHRAKREEMLEDCLMYICLNKITSSNANVQFTNRSDAQNYVVSTLNTVMKKFMSSITPIYLADELNSFGYINEAKVKKYDEDEIRLFYTLNNVALIHPCHCSELQNIINTEFRLFMPDANADEKIDAPVPLQVRYMEELNPKEIYYLVSKSFHVWFCENFSELLQNSLLFRDMENFVSVNESEFNKSEGGK